MSTQHVIVGDVDRLARDLGRHVPVADMPGEREEIERIVGADLDERLGRSPHLDEPAGLQPDGIAVIQHIGPVEVEEESRAAIGVEQDAAAMAIAVVEGDHVDDAVRIDRIHGE